MKTLIRRGTMVVVALVALLSVLPFILVLSDWPEDSLTGGDPSLYFHRHNFVETSVPLESWIAPDGTELYLRRYSASDPFAPLLVMAHGSALHGGQFERLAAQLSENNIANVLVPDLRGHGFSPKARGDVEYIGQLEDDLAALISQEVTPEQKVILLGHSSGGGLVVRFAGGQHGHLLDGAILLAPYLGHNAPTTRENSGGWAKALLRRYIGLEILNGFGITAMNALPVVQFNLPEDVRYSEVSGPLSDTYSYRLNTSYHPRLDYSADIAALPETLLIAGSDDEAFHSEQYQPTMEASTRLGRYHILEGIKHMDVVDAEETTALISAWLREKP